MSVLSPTGLETMDYSMPGWVHVGNRNFELLNTLLLRVLAMQDVDASYLPDHGLLTYRTVGARFVMRRYK
jgi:hypothetical protein